MEFTDGSVKLKAVDISKLGGTRCTTYKCKRNTH